MWAGGDLLLEVFIAGMLLVVSFFLMIAIFKYETAYTTYSRILVALSLTAPAAIGLMAIPAVVRVILCWVTSAFTVCSPRHSCCWSWDESSVRPLPQTQTDDQLRLADRGTDSRFYGFDALLAVSLSARIRTSSLAKARKGWGTRNVPSVPVFPRTIFWRSDLAAQLEALLCAGSALRTGLVRGLPSQRPADFDFVGRRPWAPGGALDPLDGLFEGLDMQSQKPATSSLDSVKGRR